MKKYLAILTLSVFTIIGCSDKKENTTNRNKNAMAQSVGRINELSIIVDNELWKGEVGETIRKYFAAEVAGLPQVEPLFSMRQMPPQAFSGISRKNRTFLKIEKGQKNIKEYTNKYATPQKGIVVAGNSNEEIIAQITENAESIIAKLKATETKEKQRRISKSLEKIPELKEQLGVELKIPTAYRLAKLEKNFFWIRKDITHGSMNLIAYELPINTIKKDSSIVANIIKMRDSIGGINIPTIEGGRFITEKSYAPFLFETTMDGNFAYETKGTWEVKNKFMAGPFVNYVIEDKKNNRLVVLEGFVFAPSVNKRDNMFELEAIMKTVKFN